MTDTGPEGFSPPYYGATPITTSELLENFEPTIDRCAAGETFVLIQDGKPAIYMVPYAEYVALEERTKVAAPTSAAPGKGRHLMEPVNIYQWVNDHNPSAKFSYGKGWWDYVTFLYHLDELYGGNKTTVVSTYEMLTPPPQETLLMPVARLETDRATFIMKTQFDGIGPAWTVSAIRDGGKPLPLSGLVNEHEELEAGTIDGFAADWVFPSYANSPARFTARVEDDWQLYTFIWVIAHS